METIQTNEIKVPTKNEVSAKNQSILTI